MTMPHICRCATCGAEGMIVPNALQQRPPAGEIVNPHVVPEAREPKLTAEELRLGLQFQCRVTAGCWLPAGHLGHCD